MASIVSSIVRGLVHGGTGGAAVEEPAEFITNGAFATDTDWTKGAGWTIGSGVATQTNDSGILTQDFGALVAALISGHNYILTYDVTAGDGGGDISPTIGAQMVTSAATSVGSKSASFTASAAHTTVNFRCIDGVTFSIDNVSLVPA